MTSIYVSFVRNAYFIHAPTSIIISVNVNVFRGFCCPFPEGRGGKGIHQAEETGRILGSTPLSEPVGLHRSGAGKC